MSVLTESIPFQWLVGIILTRQCASRSTKSNQPNSSKSQPVPLEPPSCLLHSAPSRSSVSWLRSTFVLQPQSAFLPGLELSQTHTLLHSLLLPGHSLSQTTYMFYFSFLWFTHFHNFSPPSSASSLLQSLFAWHRDICPQRNQVVTVRLWADFLQNSYFPAVLWIGKKGPSFPPMPEPGWAAAFPQDHC